MKYDTIADVTAQACKGSGEGASVFWIRRRYKLIRGERFISLIREYHLAHMDNTSGALNPPSRALEAM